MEIVTGDRYLESLVKFVENNAGSLIEGSIVLKLNPVGLQYVQSRLEALHELERLITGAPVDYLRAYISDLGDHRALEQLRRILCRVCSLKVVSVLRPPSCRDPTPLSLVTFGRLKVLELRGCDLSTAAAKGLLELRHTLEKFICHNSTDALRHVFASRIVDIKEAPHWKRLSFVSCACNSLILMDESLQLLPVVETLDLSRNNFAKVDNLQNCTRLKHLDLGFNQLRSVASLSKVTCHISKLVLRSNALTTLRGIETLKSVEGLDISYNIISSFFELEVLSSLPSLKNIWLEGNPLCCARWYRPQIFSFFVHPKEVRLDDREMSTRELWKRHIILARRQRQPASYGFYSSAREVNEMEGFECGKRKKLSRLACIESEESEENEHDPLSCDNDNEDGHDEIVSDCEGEITSLINRIEFMKKDHSRLWLDNFKDWMDQGSENLVAEDNNSHVVCYGKGSSADNTSCGHIGENSRYSRDDRSTNVFLPNSLVAGLSIGNHAHQSVDPETENGEFKPETINKAMDSMLYLHKEDCYRRMTGYNSWTANMNMEGIDKMNAGADEVLLTTVNNIMVSQTSSTLLGSPPHYQEDILHRRHDMEEEFMQLSAESVSLSSSSSDTSCDEDDEHECSQPFTKSDQFVNEDFLGSKISSQFSPVDKECLSDVGHKGSSLDPCAQKCCDKFDHEEHLLEFPCDVPPVSNNDDALGSSKPDADCYQMKFSKRKPRKRVVFLCEGSMFHSGDDMKDEHRVRYVNDINCSGRSRSCRELDASNPPHDDAGGGLSKELNLLNHSETKGHEFTENYFNSWIANSTVHETCEKSILCNCVFEREVNRRERQVALVLSSKGKLYVLESGLLDGSGNSVSVLCSHMVEDVTEVLVGLGLQVVRVYIDEDASYLLITKSIEKTRHLFGMMGFCSYGHEEAKKCSLRSLEHIQISLFDRQVCRGLGTNIYQYCMVLFWHSNNPEEGWVPRSIFVNGGCLFVCIENVLHFSSLTSNAGTAYFMLESCCSIACMPELVIEAGDKQCITLNFKPSQKEHCLSAFSDAVKMKTGFSREKSATKANTWKLKWVSADSLYKFVTLLKAIYAGITTSNLSIIYKS